MLQTTRYTVHGALYGTTSLMRLSELRGSPCCICTERELLATDDLCVAPPPQLSCRECWDTLDALLVGDEWVELDRLSDRALPGGPGLGCKCSTYTLKIESISAVRSWIQYNDTGTNFFTAIKLQEAFQLFWKAAYRMIISVWLWGIWKYEHLLELQRNC